MLISVAGIITGLLFLRAVPSHGFNLDYPIQAFVGLPFLTVQTFIGLLLISTGVFCTWRRR
jgi:hypothetical protein